MEGSGKGHTSLDSKESEDIGREHDAADDETCHRHDEQQVDDRADDPLRRVAAPDHRRVPSPIKPCMEDPESDHDGPDDLMGEIAGQHVSHEYDEG